MSNGTKTLLAIVVILILIWIGYAIVSSGPASPTATSTPVVLTPIKVGVIAPLTGDGATYGEPMRNLIQLAGDEINAAGGVAGRPLQFVFEDDRCNGGAAVSAAQKLVSVDKVDVAIGSACSGATIPAVPVFAGAKIVLESPAASSPDLTGISPYFFRDYPSDAAQAVTLAQYFANDKKWKKVAVLQEQTDYASALRKATDKEFSQFGGKTIVEEFAPGITDFRSSLAKLKAANPDALMLCLQTTAPLERVLKQLSELKWKPKIILTDSTIGDPAAMSKFKSQLEGAIGAEFGTDPANPKFQHMNEAYKAKYGTEIPYISYGQTEYDAVYILRDGIAAVGTDGDKLAAWTRTIKDWEGASGKVTIGENGDRVGGPVLKIVHNGVDILLSDFLNPAPAATSTPAAQ